ncbi:MAG: hypothetical protein EBZ77_02490 [Chitinophagia bacterium]|nr:hypothetical protein [Chitinophagia bacterium]
MGAYQQPDRASKLHNASVYRQLNQQLPDSVSVVTHFPPFEDAYVMFYCPRVTAYSGLSEEQCEQLKAKGIRIAAFRACKGKELPAYLRRYPGIVFLPATLQ